MASSLTCVYGITIVWRHYSHSPKQIDYKDGLASLSFASHLFTCVAAFQNSPDDHSLVHDHPASLTRGIRGVVYGRDIQIQHGLEGLNNDFDAQRLPNPSSQKHPLSDIPCIISFLTRNHTQRRWPWHSKQRITRTTQMPTTNTRGA